VQKGESFVPLNWGVAIYPNRAHAKELRETDDLKS
jgi:hypothetical protein